MKTKIKYIGSFFAGFFSRFLLPPSEGEHGSAWTVFQAVAGGLAAAYLHHLPSPGQDVSRETAANMPAAENFRITITTPLLPEPLVKTYPMPDVVAQGIATYEAWTGQTHPAIDFETALVSTGVSISFNAFGRSLYAATFPVPELSVDVKVEAVPA